jgi:anti-sigma-K factor RskA
MKEELSLKLQAYADGELSGSDARAIEDTLTNDADARGLLAELKNTRAALAGFEAELKLPESREFYWSKIEREIQHLENMSAETSEPSPFLAWRWVLIPAGAFVVLVIAGVLAFTQLRAPRAAESEFALANSDAFTYRDYKDGTTLVWLSYPAEKEFTDADTEDTLD